jgi:NAD(P)-dependent dehydrogenase (short-subunit alcohol dehydrogenase family)
VAIQVDLEGRVAIVTGGGRGIGRAIALALAEAGADVCVSARTASQIEETAELVSSMGRKALPIPADATDPEGAQVVVQRTVAELGGLHILVNNAGMEMPKPLLDTSLADYELVMDTNLKTAFLFTQAVGPYLIAQKYGRIVNLASIASFIAGPNQAVYHASKAAVAHFTRAMAIEWARYGINVNAIAPGWIRTELIAHLLENEEMLNRYLKGVPLRRLGEPQEIAPLVAYMCSDLASFMTGSVVVIDGGCMIP